MEGHEGDSIALLAVIGGGGEGGITEEIEEGGIGAFFLKLTGSVIEFFNVFPAIFRFFGFLFH